MRTRSVQRVVAPADHRRARANAFESAYRGWLQALDAWGHTLQSDNRGDTAVTLEPQR